MGVRTLLSELRNRPEGKTFEIWEETDGVVRAYCNGVELAQVVISTDAPNNNDGRPDGTIYIRVT